MFIESIVVLIVSKFWGYLMEFWTSDSDFSVFIGNLCNIYFSEITPKVTFNFFLTLWATTWQMLKCPLQVVESSLEPAGVQFQWKSFFLQLERNLSTWLLPSIHRILTLDVNSEKFCTVSANLTRLCWKSARVENEVNVIVSYWKIAYLKFIIRI